MPEEAPPPRPRERAWLPLAIAFAALWLAYFALLARQPADRFDGWHNDVAWPADHFMTVAQDGLLFPVFGHAMVASVGTLFIGMLLVALTRGLCRLLRLPDLGQAAARIAMIAVPLWGFAVLKAIPVRVTQIDVAAQRLDVVRFHPILRFPVGTIVLRGEDLAAFELTSYFHRRTGTRYLELFAFTRTKELVMLAERACTGDAESCLTAAHADVAELARSLGRASLAPDTTTRPGRHIVVLAPSRAE